MSIALTDEQQALHAAVTGFAARHAPAGDTRASFAAIAEGSRPGFWDALVDNGFHAVAVPEEFGGAGAGPLEAACVADAAGYGLLPGPLLPTMIAAALAAAAKPGPAAEALLGDIVAGGPAAALGPQAGSLRATRDGDGWSLTGTAGPEPGLCAAARILAAATTSDGQTRWFVLAGVPVTPAAGTDLTRDVGTLRLDRHRVGADALVDGLDPDTARGITAALLAAEGAGIARWCAENVVAHLKTREQFGRPIGAFQALAHRAAGLYVDAELMAAAAWDAARAAAQSPPQLAAAAAAAAIVVTAALPDLVLDALTMFGAIGYTWDHDLHLYWRRAIALAATAGPAGRWAADLGRPDAEPRDFHIELPHVETEFRAEVAAALAHAATLGNDIPGRQSPEHANLRSGAQRDALAAAGLLAPHLPPPCGRGASAVEQLIIAEEFSRHPDVVRSSLGIAEWILPTILTFGSEAQRQRFAEPILRGSHAWCQLFSEPGAGSDLAALSTRAERVDGGWRINGQKVWTSSAQQADFGALLARTDPEARKHRGIGYFLLDMSTPGITVRPLRTAGGPAHFNEVFLDDVFIPDDMLVAGPGEGWSLALATMANERAAISGYLHDDRESVLREVLAGAPSADGIRVLGEIRAATNAISALNLRETLSRLSGHGPGTATSVAKVATGRVLRRIGTAAMEFTGRAALLDTGGDTAVEHTFQLPAELIGGGTMEIQLNIIATMILGLPRG